MLSHLPSPPSSRPNSPDSNSTSQSELIQAERPERETQDELQHQSKEAESSKELLSDRLDALLISYLTILDTYTSLRAQLSKDLAEGFFALAQANRNANSTMGVGRRYGEEGFDERMKAGRVVRIQEAGRGGLGGICKEEEEDGDEHSVQKNGSGRKTGKTPDEQTISQRNKEDMETPKRDAEDENQQSTITSRYCFSVSLSSLSTTNISKDPLKWYGILIPPALRTCQTHFATAISSTVPDVLNAASGMRDLEEEIWAVRRQLGIIDDYNAANAGEPESKNDGAVESDIIPPQTEVGHSLEISLSTPTPSSSGSHKSQPKKSSSFLSTSPPSAKLPSEPPFRVLKLD